MANLGILPHVLVFLVLLLCRPSIQKDGNVTNATIMFDVGVTIDKSFLENALYELRRGQYPRSVLDSVLFFQNFPKMNLYSRNSIFEQRVKEVEENNTFFTFGSKSFYGFNVAKRNLNTSIRNFTMQYIPIFNFPVELYIKIVSEIYGKITQSDESGHTNTLFVIDLYYVSAEEPWKEVQVLNYILKYVTGSLRFIYYWKNAQDIARKIRDNNFNVIVLLVNSTNTQSILEQANARNLFKWRYRWIIYLPVNSDLDVYNLGFNSDSKNITVIQFANVEASKLKLTSSIRCAAYDALKISLDLLTYLLESRTDSSSKEMEGKTGSFSLKYVNLFKNTSFSAVERSSWIMHIFAGLGQSAARVGNITGGRNEMEITSISITVPKRKDVTKDDILKELREKVFQIITIIEPPFVMYKKNHSKYTAMKDKLEGFVIDIVEELMKSVNISYSITLDPSNLRGSRQEDGRWDGMTNQIINGQADLAAGGFLINDEQKAVVDFLESFSGFKGSILYKTNNNEGVRALFQFLLPIDSKVWATLVGSTLAVAVALAIIHCISPNKTNYNLYESFFFSLGSLFQGVTTTPPNKVSGRILVCFWWFFSLMIAITYIINYGIYRVQARSQGEISSLQDLLKQNVYKYGTVRGSTYETILKTSTLHYLQQMNKMIRQEFKNGLVNSTDIALNLTKAGSYAFIWDSTINNYLGYQHCLSTSAHFNQYYYAFIVPKNSDYRTLFNQEILAMKANNKIARIMAKYPYLDGNKKNSDCEFAGFFGTIKRIIPKELSKYSSSTSLTLEQTLGIFFIMFAGCILSLILSIIECSCRRCCVKYYERKKEKTNAAAASSTKKNTESFA